MPMSGRGRWTVENDGSGFGAAVVVVGALAGGAAVVARIVEDFGAAILAAMGVLAGGGIVFIVAHVARNRNYVNTEYRHPKPALKEASRPMTQHVTTNVTVNNHVTLSPQPAAVTHNHLHLHGAALTAILSRFLRRPIPSLADGSDDAAAAILAASIKQITPREEVKQLETTQPTRSQAMH